MLHQLNESRGLLLFPLGDAAVPASRHNGRFMRVPRCVSHCPSVPSELAHELSFPVRRKSVPHVNGAVLRAGIHVALTSRVQRGEVGSHERLEYAVAAQSEKGGIQTARMSGSSGGREGIWTGWRWSGRTAGGMMRRRGSGRGTQAARRSLRRRCHLVCLSRRSRSLS